MKTRLLKLIPVPIGVILVILLLTVFSSNA